MKTLAYIAQRKNTTGDEPGGEPFANMNGESLDDIKIPQGQEKPADELNIEQTPEEIAAQAKANEGKTPEELATAQAEAQKPLLDAEGNPIVKTEFDISDIGGETTTAESDEASWADVAELVGLKLEEDSQEAFLAADQKRIEEIKKQAVAEHLVKTEGMNPEALRLVESFKNGATELGIYKVEEPYRDFLAFSPEEKVKQTLLAANYTEEHAQRKVDEHIENGTLDDEVARIDANVSGMMKAKVNEYFAGLDATAAQDKQKTMDRIASENKLVESAVLARAEFSGFKLSDDLKKTIIARWNNGTYRQAFESDPNAVVDFILERELGKKARELAISTGTREFRQGVQAKLQTLEGSRQAAASSSGVNTASHKSNPDDPFSGWDSINSSEVETKARYSR